MTISGGGPSSPTPEGDLPRRNSATPKAITRGFQPPGPELDYAWEKAMLGPVTSPSSSRTASAEIGLGTIAMSLAALSMALFAYFF